MKTDRYRQSLFSWSIAPLPRFTDIYSPTLLFYVYKQRMPLEKAPPLFNAT
jgi:hypothetical protein